MLLGSILNKLISKAFLSLKFKGNLANKDKIFTAIFRTNF